MRADSDKLDASRLALQLDFVLLTLYGLTFVVLGLLLVRRGRRWAIAGVALIAAAILTCVFDVVENVLTLRLIPADVTEPSSSSGLDTLPTVSYAKWTASALTVGVATLLFVGRSRARIVIFLALFAGAAALVGLAGVVVQSRVTHQTYFKSSCAATAETCPCPEGPVL